MSTTIDERVVSLEFDNSEFENNVKTSMSTLDKLKAALNFDGASKGIEDLEVASRKCDLSALDKSVGAIGNSFSAMEAVALGALSRIGYQAIGTAESLVKSMMGINNLSSGWAKYAEQTTAVQTILSAVSNKINEATGKLYDTNDIMQVVGRLRWYSDETSYSLEQMTNAIGNFTSAGVDLNIAERAVQGIANACADAGVNTQMASHAFSGFSKAIGQGNVTLSLWNNQLKTAGIANSEGFKQQLIDTAVAAGRLEEVEKGLYRTTKKTAKANQEFTIGSFETSLTDSKWLDSQTLLDTFDRYVEGLDAVYEEVSRTGETTSTVLNNMRDEIVKSGKEIPLWLKAMFNAQEAVTFAQAIDSVKEAVGSQWAESFTYMFGSLDQAKQTWTTLANDLNSIFVTGAYNRNEVFNKAFAMDGWDRFIDRLETAGLEYEDFENRFKSWAESQYGAGGMDRVLGQYKTLEEFLRNDKNASEKLTDFLKTLSDQEFEVTKQTGITAEELEKFQKIYDEIWSGKWGNGAERLKKLSDAGYDYYEIQKLINSGGQNYKLIQEDLKNLTEAEIESLGYTEEQIESIKELGNAANNADPELKRIIDQLSEDSSGQENLYESIHNLCDVIIDFQTITRDAWSEALNLDSVDILYQITKGIKNFTETLSNSLMVDEELTDKGRALYAVIRSIGNIFRLVGTVIKQISKGAFSILEQILSGFNITLGDFSENIANNIEQFVNWVDESQFVYNAIVSIKDILESTIDTVSKWIDGFNELPLVKEIVSGFNEVLDESKEKLDSFGEEGANASSTIETIFGGAIETVTGFVGTFKDILGDTDLSLSNIMPLIGGGAATAINGFTTQLNNFSNGFENAGGSIEGVSGALNDFIDLAIGLGIGYSVLSIIKDITGAVGSIAKPFTAFNDVLSSISGAFKKFGDFWFDLESYYNSISIINLGIAIALLAGSLFLMSKIDSQAMGQAMIGMILIAGGISAIAFSLGYLKKQAGTSGKDGKNVNIGWVALLILSIAAAILTIVHAIKVLSEVENLGNAVVSVVAVILTIAGAVWLMQKNATLFQVSSKVILSLAAGMYIMALAIRKLAEVPIANAFLAASILVAFAGTMSLVTNSLSKIDKFGVAHLLGLAAALILFYVGIKAFSSIKKDEMVKGLTNTVAVLSAFVLAMLALRFVAGAGKEAAVYVVGLALALNITAKAISKLGAIPFADLIKGSSAAIALLSVMSIIMAKIAAETNGITGLGIRKAISVSLMMGTLVTSLLIVAGALYLLKRLSVGDLTKTVIAITVTMLAIAKSMAIIMKDIQKDYSWRASSIMITVIMAFASMVAAIYILSRLSVEDLTVTVMSITAIIASLIGLMLALSVAEKSWNCVLILGAVIGLVYEIGKVVEYLVNIGNVDQTIKIVDSLTTIFISLGVLAALIGAGAYASAMAIATGPLGLIAVAGLVSAVTGIIVGLSSLIKNNDISFIANGAEKLGEILGKFLGGIVGGIAAGSMDVIGASLPEFGDNLSLFMEAMSREGGFFDGLNKMPEDIFSKITSFWTLISTLGDPTNLSYLTNLDYATELIGKLGEEDGLFATFASTLKTLSDELTKDTFNFEAIDTAARAAESFGNLIKAIPTTGGFATSVSEFFFGETDVDGFGQNISTLCEDLVDAGDILKTGGFDNKVVESATSAGNMLAALFNSLPDDNGLLQDLAGHKTTLGEFGEGIRNYAIGLNDLMLIMSGGEVTLSDGKTYKGATYDQKYFDNAKLAGDTLATLANSLPEHGGLMSLISGQKTTLGEFGEGIRNYAIGLNDLMLIMSGNEVTLSDGLTYKGAKYDQTSVDNAKIAGDAMAELANSLGTNNFWEANNFTNFGTGVGNLGEGLASFMTHIAGIDGMPSGTRLTYIYDAIAHLSDDQLANSNLDSFAAGVFRLSQNITTFVTSMSGFVDGGSDKAAIVGFKDGIEQLVSSLTSKASNKITGFVNNVVNAMDVYDKAVESGKHILEGLRDGLQNSLLVHEIVSQGYNIGFSAITAINAASMVHSPSKATMQTGEYILEGLCIGLSKNLNSVEDNAYAAGETAIDAIKDSIAAIYFDDDLNLQPTITPILDLSDVESGMSTLSGLLNNNSTTARANVLSGFGQNGTINNNNITMHNVFNVTTEQQVDEATLNRWANTITNNINKSLGKMVGA